jgi:hypothetical protein
VPESGLFAKGADEVDDADDEEHGWEQDQQARQQASPGRHLRFLWLLLLLGGRRVHLDLFEVLGGDDDGVDIRHHGLR